MERRRSRAPTVTIDTSAVNQSHNRQKVSKPTSRATTSRYGSKTSAPRLPPSRSGLSFQPSLCAISEEQPAAEVKPIYAGLTMMEAKTNHIDRNVALAVRGDVNPRVRELRSKPEFFGHPTSPHGVGTSFLAVPNSSRARKNSTDGDDQVLHDHKLVESSSMRYRIQDRELIKAQSRFMHERVEQAYLKRKKEQEKDEQQEKERRKRIREKLEKLGTLNEVERNREERSLKDLAAARPSYEDKQNLLETSRSQPVADPVRKTDRFLASVSGFSAGSHAKAVDAPRPATATVDDEYTLCAEGELNTAGLPPVTRQSLTELDIQNIITNVKLRHDINFDRDLSFRPNFDGAKGREKIRAASECKTALMVGLIQDFIIDYTGEDDLEAHIGVLDRSGRQLKLDTISGLSVDKEKWGKDFAKRHVQPDLYPPPPSHSHPTPPPGYVPSPFGYPQMLPLSPKPSTQYYSSRYAGQTITPSPRTLPKVSSHPRRASQATSPEMYQTSYAYPPYSSRYNSSYSYYSPRYPSTMYASYEPIPFYCSVRSNSFRIYGPDMWSYSSEQNSQSDFDGKERMLRHRMKEVLNDKDGLCQCSHCSIRRLHRRAVQEHPQHLPTNLSTQLSYSSDSIMGFGATSEVLTNEIDGGDIIGRRAINRWKQGPGSSKNWKARSMATLNRRRNMPNRSLRLRELLLDDFSLSDLSNETSSSSQGHDKHSKANLDSNQDVAKTLTLPRRQPLETFIRLQWNTPTNAPTFEHFLAKDEILKSQYQVQRFLRSDNHADVYLVADLQSCGMEMEAHIFLKGLEGNWRTYAHRKIQRMRNSEFFHASFKHEGSQVLLMKARTERPLRLKVGNYDQEFPVLQGNEGIVKRIKKQAHTTRFTYAKVVARGFPEEGKDRGAIVDALSYRERDKRERKAKKQREKRRADREKKRLGDR